MTPDMLKQLQRLQRGENIASSDYTEDRARQKLKRMGLVIFDRTAWRWGLTEEGRRAAALPDNQEGAPR